MQTPSRLIVGLLLASLTALALTPAAASSHNGPCTHEYVEAPLAGLEEGSATQAVKYTGYAVVACTYRAVGPVCQIVWCP